MKDVIILQRVVPHYRVPIFSALHQRFGWKVVSAKNPPRSTGLSLCKDGEFLRLFPFSFPRPDRPYLTVVPLRQIMQELAPRAIIAEFSLQMSSTWQLGLSPRMRRNLQFLFWSHGPNLERTGSGVWSRLAETVRLRLAERADAHITYTDAGRDYLLRNTAIKDCFVATNTLDIAGIRTVSAANHALVPPGRPMLTAIGRMTPDKNLPGLVKTFSIFKKAFPDSVLFVIGGGANLGPLSEIEDNIRNSITFLGPLYDEKDIAQYLNASDLCIIPGAAGLSVNHALAYGLPVLLFEQGENGPHHHPEIEFIVEGVTGWRVRPATPQAMAARLIEIFSKQSWPKDALRGSLRRYVDENLMLENMIDGFRHAHNFLNGANNRVG
jgi:glycosyltransferase involved in cell wall biosynthesis